MTNQKDLGTIVVVMANTKSEYSKTEIIEKSQAIDPIVNTFEGYLGRKMAFENNKPERLAEFVYYTDTVAFQKASEIEMKHETFLSFFDTMQPKSKTILIASPKIVTATKKGQVKTVELVIFKTKPEFSEAEVIKAAEAINPILNQLDGFISRKLALTEQGEWLDILYWTSNEKLEIAIDIVMANDVCKTYFDMSEEDTTKIINFNVVIDTEP